MMSDPFDFFNRFFENIVNLTQGTGNYYLYSDKTPPKKGSFEMDGREVIPLKDRWILIEELGSQVKEGDTTVTIEDRVVKVYNPIVNVKRTYKLAKNMTGEFEWSIRNGYLQLDLYINSEGKDDAKGM